MKWFALLIPVFFLGCSFFDIKPREFRSPASDPRASNRGWVEPKIDARQKLTYDRFRILMLGSQPSNMDRAVELLAKRYPEYMKFYTLMYNSFSLHESSYEEPRAIVFGPDARFIVSFNGNVHQRGGTSFEVVEYSEKSNEFEFRELTFKRPHFNREELGLTKAEIEYENENMILSKANPGKCQECHLTTNGPTWQNSFVWPGAYGSAFNNLYLSFDKASRDPNDQQWWQTDRPISNGYQMALREGSEDTEVQGMIRYLQRKPKHSRLKWLPAQISDAAFLKYATGTPMSELDLSKEYQAERERLAAGPTWPSKPNQFFQQALMKLNNRRIIARLRKVGIQRNEFAHLPWGTLEDSRDGRVLSVEDMATKIQTFLSQAKMRKGQPSYDKILASLRSQIRSEISMNAERISNQQDNFGKGSLYFLGDSRNVYRSNLTWMGNSFDFYYNFKDKKSDLTEIEKIAAASDAENIVMLIAVDFLVLDRGMDLEDSVITPRQFTLSYYRNGLTEAMKYMGYDPGDAL